MCMTSQYLRLLALPGKVQYIFLDFPFKAKLFALNPAELHWHM